MHAREFLFTISKNWLVCDRHGQHWHACGSRYAISPIHSHNKRAAEVGRGLGPDMLHTPLPVGAKIVVAQAIMPEIDDLLQPRLELGPLRRIYFDLEHRILHTLAKVA